MSKIEKYLQYVIHTDDVKKVIPTFIALFDNLNIQLN